MRIYELNIRANCRRFDDITDSELQKLAELGFDAVWLMGVWQISDGALRISKLVSDDFEGSPYAVPAYKFSRRLGGQRGFQALVKRAHKLGLAVIVDFVSNHMALDSPWIDRHPEFFIRSDTRVRNQATSDYFLHKSGEVIAFGRDPYFPPWHDTAQLDYTCKALRSQMTHDLRWISRFADGVRCDMAMLVLRDHIKRQWYPLASDEAFNARMPKEFWGEAITAVKVEKPDFKFIAEAYWDKERELRELGFDLTYEKKLYDGLVARDARLVAKRLALDLQSLRASLYFIENHDEPRASSVFSRAGNLASAALILALPGSVLIHEGQMEGKREKLPVQRVKPLVNELPDQQLRAAYKNLLQVTAQSVFRNGGFEAFNTDAFGVIAFLRKDSERLVAYIGQIADAWHDFDTVPLNLSAVAGAAGARHQLRLTNLLSSTSTIIKEQAGVFWLHLSQLGIDKDSRFCLLETSSV
ncbi:MAG TPA: alpha-amylase family glycosyl hydrolase [Blastocatellia bacterium]|nr:alpha-amylase family glycosyl hydrolase [Blastocatellia bacterium]